MAQVPEDRPLSRKWLLNFAYTFTRGQLDFDGQSRYMEQLKGYLSEHPEDLDFSDELAIVLLWELKSVREQRAYERERVQEQISTLRSRIDTLEAERGTSAD